MFVRVFIGNQSTDLCVVLHFHSTHSWALKANVVFGQCLRILNISSNLYQADNDIRVFLGLMVAATKHVPLGCVRYYASCALPTRAKNSVEYTRHTVFA